ncbi:MAG: twin-arginine translocation pathway signal protein [Cytophagaceae bacterium]|nr:twin-arginine translocation pathway signal protein [Cytophagaceae bacterium]
MNRRENIKSLLLGGASATLLSSYRLSAAPPPLHHVQEQLKNDLSNWHNLQDINWAGPKYWGNRLQDWSVVSKKLECNVQAVNRTLHHLTMQLGNAHTSFKTHVRLNLAEDVLASSQNKIGFELGSKSWNFEYRASLIHGEGLRVGITTAGNLFIGDEIFDTSYVKPQQLNSGIILAVGVTPMGKRYAMDLEVYDIQENLLARVSKNDIARDVFVGNIALLSHFEKVEDDRQDTVSCRFDHWELAGDKLERNDAQIFGPLCFTQYTRQQNLVKLTAQLCPVPLPAKVSFEIRQGSSWKHLATAAVEYPSYTAQYRFENWQYEDDKEFRVVYDLDFLDASKEKFTWEGTIAKEPASSDEVKAMVCSCNHDMGFPDQDVVAYGAMHKPDILMFLGDQFYEINGNFKFQVAPLEKAYLDYLRKWYMFGWSYRKLFQHVPVINLPDDHDVFQGNLFGANGIEFPKATMGKAFKRDYGGFMMPPEWVNLAMTTQTSHMPDAFDPTPIERGIHVFYSNWDYAGISFGIVEDRKFKSGPAAVLPKKAEVRDAFVENKAYDIKKHDYPKAHLVGTRQIDFLEHWVENWKPDTAFKILLSAAPFHALQTLPDENSNGRQQKLEVPEKGNYVTGDIPVADMDSGGWPQHERDELLKIIRKGYTLHLAGDQHLPSVSQYGVDDYQDAGYSFAVPALANSWPRRWWPSIKEPLDGQPGYTGNHEDAFGNKIHVRAVANPFKTGLEPVNLYDRSPGYGIVVFNKKTREVRLECWPRYVNPIKNSDGQFDGWPVVVHQLDNNRPKNAYFLPKLNVKGIPNALVRVKNKRGKTEHILRIVNDTYEPLVHQGGTYSIEVMDAEGNRVKEFSGLEATLTSDRELNVVG